MPYWFTQMSQCSICGFSTSWLLNWFIPYKINEHSTYLSNNNSLGYLQINAVVNRAAGKGYEKEDFYENIKFQFMSIENIHVMRSSLAKLLEGKVNFLNCLTAISYARTVIMCSFLVCILHSKMLLAEQLPANLILVILVVADDGFFKGGGAFEPEHPSTPTW